MTGKEDEIIIILDELIAYCESAERISMHNVYKIVKNDFSERMQSVSGIEALSLYFCGYLLKAEPPDYEYIRVEKIVDFLEEQLPNEEGIKNSQLGEMGKHHTYFKRICR